jgi:hypothetical protein
MRKAYPSRIIKKKLNASFMDTTLNVKPWYTSKTILLAIAQAIIGIVVVLETSYPGVGGLVMAKSAMDILLRFITDAPIQ